MPKKVKATENADCFDCWAPGMRWANGTIRTFFTSGGLVPLCRQHAVERRLLDVHEYTAEEALWLASRKVRKNRRVAVVLARHPVKEE